MSDVLGAKRARVQLQRPARIEDALGGAQLTWIDEGEAWAQVSAGAGGEAPAYDALRSTVTYVFAINRRDDLRKGWRVLWRARVFAVIAVRDEGQASIDLVTEEEAL